MIEMELIAYLAAFFKSTAFLPQAFNVLKTRQTDGLSLTTYAILVLGIGMWLCYAIINGIWPLAIASTLSFTLSTAIFLVMLHKLSPRARAFFSLLTRHRRTAR